MKNNEKPDILSRIRNMKFRKELTALLAFFVMISTSYAMIHPGEALNNNVARSFMFFEEEASETETAPPDINALLDADKNSGEAEQTEDVEPTEEVQNAETASAVPQEEQGTSAPTSTPAETVVPTLEPTSTPANTAAATAEATSTPEAVESADTETAESETSPSTSPETTASAEPTGTPEATASSEPSSSIALEENETYPAIDFGEIVPLEEDGTETEENIKVVIKAPEGAFPEGTTVKVVLVRDVKVLEAIEKAAVDAEKKDVTVKQVQAVDITFTDKDGNELQPLKPIAVSFKSELVKEADSTTVVHVEQDENKENIIDTKTVDTVAKPEDSELVDSIEEDEVVIEADSFSIYGFAGIEVITVDYLTEEGTTYEINVDVSGISNLPEKASLKIKPVTGTEYEEYKAKATAAVGVTAAQVTYANLLDISIIDKNGKEFQPKEGETVKVEIKLLDKKESKDTQVVHFGTNAEILDTKVDGDIVTFETSGFSIYAIIGTDDTGHQVRVKYVFQNADGSEYLFTNTAGETHDNQIIKNGEALENVGIPTINPNGETFNGWYIYDPTGGSSGTGALTANKISFYPTTIALSTGAATTTITSTSVAISDADNTFDKEGADDPEVDYTIYVRPSFGPVYYLTFWNEVDGNVIYTKLQIPADANVYDISQQEAVPPDAIVDPETGEVVEYVTYAFTGWSETAGTYEAMKEDTDSRTEITNTTITVTEDMDLYPIFRRAHWISFYTAETGSGASYVPPVYIQSGQQASTKRPANPTWEGHTFVGWFTTEDDNPLSNNETTTGSFNWNQTLNEDITLYAHWNAGTANYTIVYWQQLVTDDKNAADSNKKYEYGGQENKTGQVTSTVTPGQVAKVPTGFHINTTKSDTSTTILADGTAQLNVYLDRNTITMRFYTYASGTYNQRTGASQPSGLSFGSDYWTNGSSRVTTYTGLYGQTWTQAGYTTGWPSPGNNQMWWYYTANTSYSGMTFLGQFVLPGDQYTTSNVTNEIRFFKTSINTYTVSFFLQNTDGSTYPDNADSTAIGLRNGNFKFSEKYDGFTLDQYRIYNGRSWGSWYTATEGSSVELTNNMQVRYKRLRYTVKFLDSRNGTELTDVPAVSVVYGATLNNVKPNKTNPEDITPPSSEYQWTGKWYADQECTTEFDWSQTMPNHDIAVYVDWNEIWYWIKIDPDGGELTSTEATWFWEPKGELVEEYHDVTRTYVEDPNGTWYYHYDEFDDSDPDADRNKSGTTYVDSEGRTRYARRAYYTQDASLSTDGKTYSEDPKAYSLVGWYEVDKETGELLGQYDFEGGVSGDTILRAVWRTVGQYRVQYSVEGVNEDGTPLYEKDESGAYTDTRVTGANPPTDNNKYADKSNSAISAAIGVEPEGYVFTGWYYNGKVYNPGDKYTLMAELDVLNTEGLDNVKDDTITIYPVFIKYEDLPVKTTHIYWYGNTVDNTGTAIDGVTSANEPKDETTHQDLQVNKAINIKKYTELPNVSTLYAGYEFKGWAKIEESVPNSTAVTPWLVWDKDTETYTVDGVAGVTQIAADEILSASGDYEKLVAVWEKEKYSVTVIKEVESSLSGDQDVSFVFTPSFPAGLGTDVQTNFSLSGSSDPKVFTDGNTDNPQTKFVPYKSTFSITEQMATGFDLTSVTGEYTDDNGEMHTIDNLSNGKAIEVLGDTVITFKNTRQLVDIVVKKTLVNPYIAGTDGVDFSFTATWGTDGSANFNVNSSSADGYRIKDVPVGAEMVITEGADDVYEYTVTAAGTNSTDTDEVANTYTFEVPATDETVTFTNTVVTVDGINVTKTDDKTPATGLEGAEFTLTRNNKLDGTGSNWIAMADPYSGTLTSGANGVLINAGTLPVGTYKLTENKSPDGYIITNNEVVFSVAEGEDGKLITKISGDNASVSDDGKTLYITNKTGDELPHTGGYGTLPYTLGGITVMLTALMYGFRMRRRERRLN